MMLVGPFLAALWLLPTGLATAVPIVVDSQRHVTYRGLDRNGIEVFLNIPYGHDTGGTNRFKPPTPRVIAPDTTVQASAYGPACPQPLGGWFVPLSLSNVTEISEDCLNLNVARPKGTEAQDRLPVMVFIHGGSFWSGQNRETTISPDGLILESVQNRLPEIHVAMNYRLGVFGFAQSGALRSEGSENAGLRDQRLAIEWVRNNIQHFGGDQKRITIFGQSSGGLAVGLQIMAYGASKPVPFQQGICQSQALEPGITGKFTANAMQALVNHVGCNSTSLHSQDTLTCLRSLNMGTLLNSSIATYRSDIAHNIGDMWLPVVDGDFLPAAPSQLIREGRFSNITTMIGWCEDDLTVFTETGIKTPADTLNFISTYLPDLASENVRNLLQLYPVSGFPSDDKAGLSSEFFRASRIFRDILMTCPSILYAERIAAVGNEAYLYGWNQTILDSIVAYSNNQSGLGAFHTSEFAYIFGNLSHYNISGYPFNPTDADYRLRDRSSRSWSTFASIGRPGLQGHDTLQGFEPAFSTAHGTSIFVIGGPHGGLSALDGPRSHPPVASQKLRDRCAYLNSPEIIKQLKY